MGRAVAGDHNQHTQDLTQLHAIHPSHILMCLSMAEHSINANHCRITYLRFLAVKNLFFCIREYSPASSINQDSSRFLGVWAWQLWWNLHWTPVCRHSPSCPEHEAVCVQLSSVASPDRTWGLQLSISLLLSAVRQGQDELKSSHMYFIYNHFTFLSTVSQYWICS